MTPIRLCLALLLSGGSLAAMPAFADAAPPLNDNYLGSLTITQSPFTDTEDTTEATTQPDLFNPNAQGQPLGGAGPEDTSCNGTPIGKTVWYDLATTAPAGAEIQTSGAFDQAVAVYEWDPSNSRITKKVSCTNTAGTSEDVILSLKRHTNYTFQVGGVNGAGGPLTFKLEYFPDTDGDSIPDAIDDCKTVPGIPNSGCPPVLKGKVGPKYSVTAVGAGVRFLSLFVDSVPKGAKVVAKAGGATQTVKAKKTGRVKLPKLVGKTAAAGSKVSVSVVMTKNGTGKYRYGAFGALYRWTVANGALKSSPTKCLKVGSATKTVACP